MNKYYIVNTDTCELTTVFIPKSIILSIKINAGNTKICHKYCAFLSKDYSHYVPYHDKSMTLYRI